ncbi:MAG: signal recognition particle-docking protein FtsY [Alphaproteobacteria bacterium]|nr:signal recognition particle-docking protein FtsY [Alphaproteobacteria bacterium]
MVEMAKRSWLGRLRQGLSRSADSLGQGITGIFSGRKLDGATLEELEDLLVTADMGIDAARRIVSSIASRRIDGNAKADIRGLLAEEIEKILSPVAVALEIDQARAPFVVLVVGVNGTGKTTTIGKLAHLYISQGLSVSIAAGDTFRAAAIDQLKVWGERADADVFAKDVGADPAGLAFDAWAVAKSNKKDVLLIDTAGRLQNKTGLMAELEKIVRVVKKQDSSAPHSVILVLDATTGQNVHSQVELFRQACDVSGLIMTKLDGTARGGVLVAVAERFGLPIHAIGVGEQMDDLRHFDAGAFARALVGVEEPVGA